jgi:hypothetical protein
MTEQNVAVPSASTNPWADLHIDTLVMETKNYIVYIAPTIELKWETTEKFDGQQPAQKNFDPTKYYSIFSEGGVLEARVRREFDVDTRKELLCLIGNALVCSFECDYSAAIKALEDARQFLRERSEELSRFWYLSASFVMAILFLIIGFSIWATRSYFEKVLGTTFVWLIFFGVAGAAGALLSVILRSGKLAFDPSSGRLLHYLEGASRIWAGALSGVLVSLAIKADFIFGALGAARSNIMIVLISMAAGASERLATSIISKIDSECGKTPRK